MTTSKRKTSASRGSKKKKAPWKKAAPKGTRRRGLTSAQKAGAKRAAKRAGRPYPNLVDNMRAASDRKQKASDAPKRKRAARSRTRTSS